MANVVQSWHVLVAVRLRVAIASKWISAMIVTKFFVKTAVQSLRVLVARRRHVTIVIQWVFVINATIFFVTTAFLQAAVMSAIEYCVLNAAP